MEVNDYIEEINPDEYVLEEYVDVDKKAALEAFKQGFEVFIFNQLVEDYDVIENSIQGFSTESAFFDNYPEQKTAMAERIAAEKENKSIDIKEIKPLNFSPSKFDRYGVNDKSCYTYAPEKDFIDEILSRIKLNEITFEIKIKDVNSDNVQVYANVNEEQTKAELKVADLEQGVDIPVPITKVENDRLCSAIQSCEESKSKETEKAETKSKSIEERDDR